MRRLLASLAATAALITIIGPAHAASHKQTHAPALGDPLAVWTKAYGHFLKGTDSETPGWVACGKHDPRWQVMVSTRASHVFVVYGAFCGDNPPSAKARIALAQQHMPIDAVRIGTNTTDTGKDIVYYSASLAREGGFVPGDFLDCNMNLVRRGTFSLSLDVPSAIDWTLQLGTCA